MGKNVGWRIDYQIATPVIAACARKVKIYLDNRFSDHAPLTVDYDLFAMMKLFPLEVPYEFTSRC